MISLASCRKISCIWLKFFSTDIPELGRQRARSSHIRSSTVLAGGCSVSDLDSSSARSVSFCVSWLFFTFSNASSNSVWPAFSCSSSVSSSAGICGAAGFVLGVFIVGIFGISISFLTPPVCIFWTLLIFIIGINAKNLL